ncbi:MAG: alpha/beta fold hydrolase [Proteobacteria bacterium]|nr:alpha/beta fold hydrolase [Pseudomonadota bacterium]
MPQRTLARVDKNHHITLPDGDILVLCENRPESWQEGGRVILLVHGLTGSAFSKDSGRLGAELLDHGYRVFRINLRNCGPGFGLSQNIYHAGQSQDTRTVLRFIEGLCPGSPVTQIGFSLGANITLKMAGEDGESPTAGLDSVIAVSPPADLAASSRRLGNAENRIFEQYFVRQLKRDVKGLAAKNPNFMTPKFPEKMSLRDFDELLTAPMGGFSSAGDYYAQSSSLPHIEQISIRTLIIGSDDDPVVDMNPLKDIALKGHQMMFLTKHGGHCGYLGFGGGGMSLRWMDRVIMKWLKTLVPKTILKA